uniref:Globin family profile domain-containing protein n=1 Tax=Setaria digitata TaxID=48799 RepID=A0A915PU03_9BILA
MCGNKIVRFIWGRLSSFFIGTNLQEVVALTKDEKKILMENWLKLKEKHPDLFLRAWIKSAKGSVNIKKATGLREDEDPETNRRFISLSPLIENFVDKLIIEYHCNDTKIAESCRILGARHKLIENFHTNFWDIFLGNLVQIIADVHSEREREREQQEIAEICEKFFAFFVTFMCDGYKKRAQEELSGRRRLNAS